MSLILLLYIRLVHRVSDFESFGVVQYKCGKVVVITGLRECKGGDGDRVSVR